MMLLLPKKIKEKPPSRDKLRQVRQFIIQHIKYNVYGDII